MLLIYKKLVYFFIGGQVPLHSHLQGGGLVRQRGHVSEFCKTFSLEMSCALLEPSLFHFCSVETAQIRDVVLLGC